MRRVVLLSAIVMVTITCDTGITAPALTSIVVTPASVILTASGQPRQFTATAHDQRGDSLPGVRFTWSVDHAAVATIDTTGLVTPGGQGVTYVRATAGEVQGWVAVAVGPSPSAKAIATMSGSHTCAIVRAVTYCWGWNENGQLGNATLANSSLPVEVTTAAPFVALTQGYHSTIGLAEGQEYYTWGNPIPTVPLADPVESTTPVPNRDLTARSFSQLATGFDFACGLAADHLAYCWGSNAVGQLGYATPSPFSHILWPAGHASPPQFASLSSSSSWRHMCGLTAAGQAYCWGLNEWGQLGDGTTINRARPVAVATSLSFVELATAFATTCARTATHEVYCWGFSYSRPDFDTTPTLISQEPPLIQIINGWGTACVLTAAGEARCWGYNGAGAIGDGTWIDQATPTTVAGGLSFASISMGAEHVCGVTRDNELYCWGFNGTGSVGDGTTIDRNAPQLVSVPSSP